MLYSYLWSIVLTIRNYANNTDEHVHSLWLHRDAIEGVIQDRLPFARLVITEIKKWNTVLQWDFP